MDIKHEGERKKKKKEEKKRRKKPSYIQRNSKRDSPPLLFNLFFKNVCALSLFKLTELIPLNDP